jgi:hypothetical protein
MQSEIPSGKAQTVNPLNYLLAAIPNSKKSGGVGGLLRCKAINHEVNQ